VPSLKAGRIAARVVEKTRGTDWYKSKKSRIIGRLILDYEEFA